MAPAGIEPAYSDFQSEANPSQLESLALPPLDLNQEPPAPEAGALPVELGGTGEAGGT